MSAGTFAMVASQKIESDYVGNKIYEKGVLKQILIDGGYYDAVKKKYYYYLTDHLGNNRVVVDANGTIDQYTHYYPFGMAFAESKGEHEQRFKYNGKELDRTMQLNTYDYAARYMDPAIGRFTSIDPLAEKFYSWSPYVYVMNNPIKYIDPTGEEVINGYHSSDRVNYAAAEIHRNKYDDDAIHIFGHGNAQRLSVYNKDGNKIEISDGLEFIDFLENNSETYSKLKKEGKVTIVLESCWGGNEENKLNGNIAQKFSKQLSVEGLVDEFEVTVTAPTKQVVNSDKYGLVGTYDSPGKKGKVDKNSAGSWNIYSNTKKVGSINGAFSPSLKNIDNVIKRTRK